MANPKTKMTRFLYLAAFVFGLLLAGCSKNEAPKSLYWTPPSEWCVMIESRNPLALRLSVDPVVYISNIPWKQKFGEDEKEEDIIVMPSTLDDILPRIVAYKEAQEAKGETPVVMIGGDDRAPCSSILKAIDSAKRAQVEYIIFETGMLRPIYVAYKTRAGGCQLQYFEFPKGFKPSRELAKNIITISISKDGVFYWEDMPVTRDGFIEGLLGVMHKGDPAKALFVIRVDADTPFYHLRYALDQLMRIGILKVMIAPR